MRTNFQKELDKARYLAMTETRLEVAQKLILQVQAELSDDLYITNVLLAANENLSIAVAECREMQEKLDKR